MNTTPRPARRGIAAVAAAAVVALVAACGGGGGAADPVAQQPQAGASAYTQGAISGFGSIIVNGVRWDDSNASVQDDDGNDGRGKLKLGMVVEVEGSANAAAGTGVALAVRYGTESLGPVSAVDLTNSTLTLLGQTVEVTSSTVFENIVGGLAGIAPGTVVEVHGLFSAPDRVVATRIEARTTPPAEYRVRGTVSALNTTAKTFRLGSETIAYGTASIPPGFTLADGVQVKVRMATTQTAGAWTATRVRPIARQLGLGNRAEAEVEGAISAWTSATSFEVNGLKVDAANASFPDGQGGIVLGAKVEVKGAIVEGVLVATRVKIDAENQRGRPGREYELHGTVSNIDTQAKTFALRGLTVSYGGNVTFKDGGLAQLVNGAKVEVKGKLSADLTRIVASTIEFE